jgi:hypothetical protein
MQFFVAVRADHDQVFFRIRSAVGTEELMVQVQVVPRAAVLAAPAVTLEFFGL